ncbi:hypothetical protein BCR44DRAFT_50662 [Catenaria anguillulae PL171]|uniref:Uncharacterized protein n=1 Tax=Catenaria anguillulae PL171 TaxID=765915 RepID=A0A1Y2HV26_9FUNG|nr:hypothetical protein BCR44DRAFT_50662 [Catenaria anguillulae PL171]
MFRFAYENPLAAGFKYRLSGRVNEWRVVDAPAQAMAKVAEVVRQWQGSEDGFLDYMFEKLAELEFGFVEANDMDEAENAAGQVTDDEDEDGREQQEEERVDLARSPTFDHGELDRDIDEQLDADEDDAWFARASAVLNAMEHAGASDADELVDDMDGLAGEPHVDDDFVRMCLEQIEAANGDLDAVDIEGLVDELLVRSRAPAGSVAAEEAASGPSGEQRK